MRFSRRAHGRESVGGGGSSRSSGAMWGAPNTSEAAARRAARSTPPSRPRGTGGGTGTVANSCRGGWSHRSMLLSGAPCRPRTSHWTAPRAASGEDSFHQQDNFEEVNEHLVDLFTYRAVRTVLEQLYETDSQLHRSLHEFSLKHKPQESYQYCMQLAKSDPELGRRVMATRESLFKSYISKLANGEGDTVMSNANVKVLKDVLMHSWEAHAPGASVDSEGDSSRDEDET